jgi:hypothetical protein
LGSICLSIAVAIRGILHLRSRVERAVGAAAGLFVDYFGIKRAIQFREAFED